MDIKFKHKDASETSLEIEVEVPPSVFADAYVKMKEEIGKGVSIPGFRKGKVPSRVVESRFKEYITERALEEIIPQAYKEAVSQASLETFGNPIAKEVSEVHSGEPLRVVFEVDKKPAVTIKTYDVMVIENDYDFQLEELIEDEIHRMLRSKAQFKDSEEGAKEGDFLRINITDLSGGEKETTRKDYPVELKAGRRCVFDLYDDLLGMKKGESKKIKKKLSNEYYEEEFRGKDIEVEVKVEDVRSIILPPLTEELSKEMGFDSIEQLKKKSEEAVLSYIERMKKNDRYQAVVDALEKEASFLIPPSLLERSVEYHVHNLKHQLGGDENLFSQYLQSQNTSIDQIKEDLKPRALQEVRVSLLIDQIVEDKKIEVTEEDVTKELEDLARKYNREYKEFRKEFIQSGEYSRLRDQLQREKAVMAVFDAAPKKKGKKLTNQDIL